MARVTVEDCLNYVDNRFALVMIAAKRTQQLLDGSKPRVTARRDKAHVLALREVAEGKIKVVDNSAS